VIQERAFGTWVLALVVLWLLVCLVLLIVGIIFKSKGLMLTGGIPLGLLAAGFFGFVGWSAHLQRQSKNPAAVFEKEFGFPPPTEVKELEGYTTNIVMLYENIPPGCVYLRFTAPANIIERVRGDWLVPVQESEIRRIHLFHLPAWWDPPRIAPAVIYATNGPDRRWPGGYAVSVLYYDPTSQKAYFARECVN
jgi:hypothetical protein